ncbi:MAG: hypothetical protein ACLPWD_05860 [Methanobacterium sp.]
MDVVAEVCKIINIPKEELIAKGMLAFIEKEIRLVEYDLADIRERYDVNTKEELYNRIKAKDVESHPAWEDYITWKNKEEYIFELKEKLKIIR